MRAAFAHRRCLLELGGACRLRLIAPFRAPQPPRVAAGRKSRTPPMIGMGSSSRRSAAVQGDARRRCTRCCCFGTRRTGDDGSGERGVLRRSTGAPPSFLGRTAGRVLAVLRAGSLEPHRGVGAVVARRCRHGISPRRAPAGARCAAPPRQRRRPPPPAAEPGSCAGRDGAVAFRARLSGAEATAARCRVDQPVQRRRFDSMMSRDSERELLASGARELGSTLSAAQRETLLQPDR